MCQILANIRFRICLAWLSHEWDLLRKLQGEERNHKQNCPACSGHPADLYSQLWPNATIIGE